LPLIAGLAVSIGSHALYDLLLARPNLPLFYAASVVLVLWLWLIRVMPTSAPAPVYASRH
jgi:hypothetical protein